MNKKKARLFRVSQGDLYVKSFLSLAMIEYDKLDVAFFEGSKQPWLRIHVAITWLRRELHIRPAYLGGQGRLILDALVYAENQFIDGKVIEA